MPNLRLYHCKIDLGFQDDCLVLEPALHCWAAELHARLLQPRLPVLLVRVGGDDGASRPRHLLVILPSTGYHLGKLQLQLEQILLDSTTITRCSA